MSSRRDRDQTGKLPPAFEISVFPPGPGNGRTYTSAVPDSFEVYAIHWPSGENIGSPSLKGVRRKTVGFPGFQPVATSPSSGKIIRSAAFGGPTSANARYFPLGCHDPAN